MTHLVMCGVTRYDSGLSHPLLESLPRLIHLGKIEDESRIWRLVELINDAAEHNPTLRSPILDRLTEALFLELLQEHIGQGKGAVGFVQRYRTAA